MNELEALLLFYELLYFVLFLCFSVTLFDFCEKQLKEHHKHFNNNNIMVGPTAVVLLDAPTAVIIRARARRAKNLLFL